jgi:hypothetical protein
MKPKIGRCEKCGKVKRLTWLVEKEDGQIKWHIKPKTQ